MVALASLLLTSLITPSASAQQEGAAPVALVVDSGVVRINRPALTRAISESLQRPVVSLADRRARESRGRLSIAFEAPDRWVLRYEERDRSAWVSERIRPGQLRARLAELSATVLEQAMNEPSPPTRRRGWESWERAFRRAMHAEIIDPFQDNPPQPIRRRRRHRRYRFTEVIDPFDATHILDGAFSEVVDPWNP